MPVPGTCTAMFLPISTKVAICIINIFELLPRPNTPISQGAHGPRRICFHSVPNLTAQKSRVQTPSNPMQAEFSPLSSSVCSINSMPSTCVCIACVNRFYDKSLSDGCSVLRPNAVETTIQTKGILLYMIKETKSINIHINKEYR